MSGYWEFYEETARAISFAGSSRVSHKFTGVKQIATRDEEPNERWIESAEDAVWPLIYRWHYLRDRRNVPEQRGWFTMRQREHPEFVAQLSEANQSRGVLDAGGVWSAVGRTNACARREAFRCELAPHPCRPKVCARTMKR